MQRCSNLPHRAEKQEPAKDRPRPLRRWSHATVFHLGCPSAIHDLNLLNHARAMLSVFARALNRLAPAIPSMRSMTLGIALGESVASACRSPSPLTIPATSALKPSVEDSRYSFSPKPLSPRFHAKGVGCTLGMVAVRQREAGAKRFAGNLRHRMVPRIERQVGRSVGGEQPSVTLQHAAGETRMRVWHVRPLPTQHSECPEHHVSMDPTYLRQRRRPKSGIPPARKAVL